jgi:hypothetical protein
MTLEEMTDVADQVRPGASAILRRLLGCEWGRGIRTEADPTPCESQAVHRMVIHAPPGVGPSEAEFQFCRTHFDLAESLTVKHGGDVSISSRTADLPPLADFAQCLSTKFTFKRGAMRCTRRLGHPVSDESRHHHSPTGEEWS